VSRTAEDWYETLNSIWLKGRLYRQNYECITNEPLKNQGEAGIDHYTIICEPCAIIALIYQYSMYAQYKSDTAVKHAWMVR
jgi:hypothetical protein